MPQTISLELLWQKSGFNPNDNQKAAILHTGGPLFLPAGPGSGKTRVLLWRTLNLIVFHEINPEEIFLSTFTEKAAFQLKQGLQSLLGVVTNLTGHPFDLSKMYLGTVHSNCQKLLADRRFSENRTRSSQPVLLDELDQFLLLNNTRNLRLLLDLAEIKGVEQINDFFGIKLRTGEPSPSKFNAVTNCISLFNRLSDEDAHPDTIRPRADDERLQKLIDMYSYYRTKLDSTSQTDFSLLQQKAYEMLEKSPAAGTIFKHVIIDEYQDTNTIQEKIFFKLAGGLRNFCVVGDDDQALYRFRGATVENFVEFPMRCEKHLGCRPKAIPLNVNYRSRNRIVSFYKDFIELGNWAKNGGGDYRIADKNITAHSQDLEISVVATSNVKPDDVNNEIVSLVRSLKNSGKIQDYSQIAFLFPSVKAPTALRMKNALEDAGLKVYAPRAGRFLEVDEAVDIFSIFLLIFGKPDKGEFSGIDYNDFHDWLDNCLVRGRELSKRDKVLAQYVNERRAEIETTLNDYRALIKVAANNGWQLDEEYDIDRMMRKLQSATGLSKAAVKNLSNAYFLRIIRERKAQGNPFTLNYIINSATSLDWNVLDLFYRVCGFDHFKAMFDIAERGEDEGPVCNLGLITQYLARFLDEFSSIITASYLNEEKFQRVFFLSYIYALFRRGESEYEDVDDPFPKGRIPFLTIHQSKGLEFPVVVLGNAGKRNNGPQQIEEIVRPLLDREGEPLDRSVDFDIQRMFYVALSRAQNLLVICHPKGQGIPTHAHFKAMLDKKFPRLPDFDLSPVSKAKVKDDDLPRTYSYTGDYLLFQKCPRQYMIFRKYGFVASRSQMQFFGNVVHSTIEDLHQFLIARREKKARGATR